MTDSQVLSEFIREGAKTDLCPSPAQIKNGSYSKGKVTFNGLTFVIENLAGSFRSGMDGTGKKWHQQLYNTYGYIEQAKGVDKDKLDFFLGDRPVTGNIYVLAQNNIHGDFDEHKIMFGFTSPNQAKQAYLLNYEPYWNLFRFIRPISLEDFKTNFIRHSGE